MAFSQLPALDVLRQILRYEPDTGKLFWLPRPLSFFEAGENPSRMGKIWNAKHAGQEAAKLVLPSGYRICCIFNTRWMAHRIAWKIYTGKDPDGEIDHINGDRADNRIANLRDVSSSVNGRNKAVRSDSPLGTPCLRDKKPKAHGSRWLVIFGEGGAVAHQKSFHCFGAAIKYRNQYQAARGCTPRHGGWRSVGEVAASLPAMEAAK